MFLHLFGEGTNVKLLGLLLGCLMFLPGLASEAMPPAKPKLVVLLIIDQLSYNYLNRFQDKFGNKGFRLITGKGANFLNCRYEQATTQTAVGHAVIASGAYPWATGVVANDWFDRRKDKETLAVSDDKVQLVGGSGPGASCRAMIGTTLGDELRLSTNMKSKVIAVSLKDRAALFLAGRMANSAYWWDTRSGSFVTSSQFGSLLPSWVKAFNDSHYADRYFGRPWQKLLPEDMYTASTQDDYSYEKPFPGDGKKFPHIVTGGANGLGEAFYTAFCATPWANELLSDFACQAIEHEHLGQRQETDLLGISFSAPDYLGHNFGPYSQEMEDLILRLDQNLASLFQFLENKVGLSQCLIVLTSDHGVMPIPEFLREHGLAAGRLDPRAFKTMIDSALDTRLGADDWISSFQPPNLYLNLDAIDRQKYRQPDVEALAAKIANSQAGIADVYTAVQFLLGQTPDGPLASYVRKNYYLGRSGELFVLTKPGYIFSAEPFGTTHGSAYTYDTQVPLFIWGNGIKGGQYGQKVSPADIAPTLACLLNILAPSLSSGRVLTEALADSYGPPNPNNFSSQLSQSQLVKTHVTK